MSNSKLAKDWQYIVDRYPGLKDIFKSPEGYERFIKKIPSVFSGPQTCTRCGDENQSDKILYFVGDPFCRRYYALVSPFGTKYEAEKENTKKGGFASCLSDSLFYFLVVLNIIAFLATKKKWRIK